MSIISEINRISSNFSYAIETLKQKTGTQEVFNSYQLINKLSSVVIGDKDYFDYLDKNIVSLSSNSKAIPAGFFKGHNKLSSVILNNISTLNNEVFLNCNNLQKADFENLSFVGAYAFNNCSSLTSLNADNIKSIKTYGFGNCINLSSINLSNVEYIEEGFLINNSNITEIDLPNIKTVLYGAFINLENLSSINFHNVDDISYNNMMFYNDMKLQKLYVDEDNQYYKTNDDNTQIILKETNQIILMIPSISVLYDENIIEMYEVPSYSLKVIDLPNATYLEYSLFEGNENIVSVSVPSLEYLNYYVFYDCTNLEYVNLSSLTDFDTDLWDEFSECPKLKQVVINNDSFHSVDNGFGDPDQVILNSDNEITCIVRGIERYKNLEIQNLNCGFTDFCTNVKDIITPNLTVINDYEFSNCQSLSNLDISNIPELALADYAFYYCYNLPSLDCSKFTLIGQQSFRNCSSLVSVDLPICKATSSYSFGNCTSLSTVIAPQLSSIALNTFNGDTNLISVYIPSASKLLGNVFVSCTSLKYIDFGTSLTAVPTIATSTFPSSLKPVTPISCFIPDNLYNTWSNATNWVTQISLKKVTLVKQSERTDI